MHRIWTNVRAARLAGLLALCALAWLAAMPPAHAQETPEPTAAATDVAPPLSGDGTTLQLQIDAPEQPVPVGDVIRATVLVENVEHLAGFDFTITYDPDRLRLIEADQGGTPVPTIDPALGGFGVPSVQVDELGGFLAESGRGGQLFCQVPSAGNGQVVVNCNTAFAPACLGGPDGASGTGTLSVIPFESRGGGTTTIEITSSTLVLDDIEPCDTDDGRPQAIEHTRGAAATLELAAKDDSSTMLIIIIVIVVVVVVAAGGGGYYAYRRSQGGPSES